MKIFMIAVVSMLLFGVDLAATAQIRASGKSTSSEFTEAAAKVQRQLEARYALTKITPDGAEIIAPGAVLVLQMGNLALSKVYMNATQRGPAIENLYSKGEITQIGFTGALSKVNSFLSFLGGLEAQSRTFSPGNRLWATGIALQPDGIVFRLLSDPINGMRYHGTLRFPYPDISAMDEMLAKVAGVFDTDPPIEVAIAAPAQAVLPPEVAPVVVEAQPTNRIEEARQAAEAGDVNAMYQLGNLLADGGKNDVDAARWFRQASERGHVKATNALGFMYEEGRGVPQNFEQAGRLYLQAMKKGDADAMVNRGFLYDKGRSVATDPVQAYMHFLLAVAYAPDKETRDAAVKLRDDSAAKLSKLQVAKGQALADKFAKEQIK